MYHSDGLKWFSFSVLRRTQDGLKIWHNDSDARTATSGGFYTPINFALFSARR